MGESSARALAAAARRVTDDAPGGVNVRFEADFETLKAEMDKISGLGGEGVDWGRVAALASDILEGRSKDLLVASYLALALFHQEGYAGLAAGIETLRVLVTGFWDHLFPEPNRMRARVGAIEWFVERATAGVQQREPGANEAEAPAECVDKLGELDDALAEKFGGDAPAAGDLRAALQERAAAAPKPAPEPPPAPAAAPTPSAPPAAAPVVAAPTVADLGSSDAVEGALKECLLALRSVATALRRGNPKDPVAYRLARVAAWGRLRRPPPDTDGETRVPAAGASTEAAQRFEGLAARGAWGELLEQAETQFAQSVFWLDVQWHVARALKALGPEYAIAREVVVHETGLLARAFPSLLDLSFESGFPFVSGVAREWIDGEVLSASASGAAAPGAGGASAAGDEELKDALARAREKIDAGHTDEGIALLQGTVGAAPSRRDRFVRRLALARTLASAGEHRLALAQLESAEEEIAAYRLDDWEPRLSAEAFELAFVCQRAVARGEGPDAAEAAAKKLDGLLSRLARLDAAAAMRLRARTPGS